MTVLAQTKSAVTRTRDWDVMWERYGITAVLLVLGSLFSFVAALGMLRLPDTVIRMHAATKAIAGHSDVMAGLLVTSTGRADRLRHERALTGAIPGSLDVWLALRGVRTLAIRQERAAATASTIDPTSTRWEPPSITCSRGAPPSREIARFR